MGGFAALTVGVLSIVAAMVIGEQEPAPAVMCLCICAIYASLLWRAT